MIAIYLLIIFSNINKFQAKDSEIKTRKLCLGGFSDDFSLSDFTALSKIYHFSLDYQLATNIKYKKFINT